MKRKQINIYLSDDDTEKLHDAYENLFKQVKAAADNEYLTPAQTDKECEILSRKYDFEIEKLLRQREVEYLTNLAEIEAKNKEQTPWRRCWLWRLLGKPLTNRAQDIIERRAALDAEEKFSAEEKELDKREKKIYGTVGQTLSRRKRAKLLKKYLHIQQLLEEDKKPTNGAADDVQEAAEQGQPATTSEEELPPPPPVTQSRKQTAETTTQDRA